MNVEYTGRQYDIPSTIRKQVEQGLAKLSKILGNNFETHVILAIEKHRCIAEITVTARSRAMVGLAEAGEMVPAVGEALDRIERQAVKYKTRMRTRKRQSHNRWVAAEAPVQEMRMAVGASASTAVPVVVHTFPPMAHTTETHVVRSRDSVAMRPMTIEEAVKEAEFRDRDVFVFRDTEGRVKVLHRTKDGKMELIEAP
ncbi:MAG: ribosome-associated translation inhibitor RaiA [Candidatus Korobacteraceae bacterium]